MNKRHGMTVIGSLITTMFTTGTFSVLAVFLVPISKTYTISIGQASLVFSCVAIGMIAIGLVSGKIIKMFKPKLVGSVAGILVSLVFICISLTKNITIVYAFAILFGFGVVIGGYGLSMTLITWWFEKHRAKLISSLSISAAVFAIIVAPIAAKMIVAYGLQTVSLYYGIIVGLIVIINALLLLSEKPEVYNLKPYGYSEQQETKNVVTESAKKSDVSLTVKQILAFPAFWLIIIGVIMSNVGSSGYGNNQSPFYQSLGLDAVTAAFCISLFNGMRIVWTFIYGAFIDKLGVKKVTVGLGTLTAIFFFLTFLLKGYAGAIFAACTISAGSFGGVILPITLPQLFGKENAGSLIGYSNSIAGLGVIIGSPLAGFMYDALDSYQAYLIVAGILYLVMVLFYSISTSKKVEAKIELIKQKN